MSSDLLHRYQKLDRQRADCQRAADRAAGAAAQLLERLQSEFNFQSVQEAEAEIEKEEHETAVMAKELERDIERFSSRWEKYSEQIDT